MWGTKLRVLCVTAFLLVTGAACNKGKDSENAADHKKRPPPASGTMSLQGMFTYMADAGSFLDCATREEWPVAMEGDNAALERAYGQAGIAPGSPLLVTVEGRLQSRARVDRRGTETNLIVDRFVRTWPRETCGSMKKALLEETRWELLELRGEPIVVATNDKAPYLALSATKASAFGFGGCNRFFGSYTATERTLEFGTMGATRMACPEGMAQEQELFRALDATTRYEIHGSKLLLFAVETLVARFEAKGEATEP